MWITNKSGKEQVWYEIEDIKRLVFENNLMYKCLNDIADSPNWRYKNYKNKTESLQKLASDAIKEVNKTVEIEKCMHR